ncbi:M20 aminoacylase family protein [Pleomorphomonas carboxyditropha]|uniref:Amidohydrolase n=1 Tax=Pleomorphomonas carboxyditropha TaxID=2023338 RepID=A0A2G9WTZ1_9HYPH|nr:M20 aminoacylase family protein [Pleomorphomonas carboxyditropha]PIO98163.1 amidohydrolase [Pleomorphomonas carboxyditropha]
MTETVFRAFLPELVDIRRRLHQMPETGYEERQTSAFVADLLSGWGLEVTRDLAATGLVATLDRGGDGRAIGLRADMDGLPIVEETGAAYASRTPGMMHACGHDGHTTILIGAAFRLLHDDDFRGRVHFIFQPAEETAGGAARMIGDGLFERFPCDAVFALHNYPGLAAGRFSARPGAMMAAIDAATLTVRGAGGHGARPEDTVDPVVAAASIVMALQTAVSRNVPPQEAGVITVGAFHAGSACNVIPDEAVLEVSLRATDPAVRTRLCRRFEEIVRLQAASYGAEARIDWQVGYPVTMNDAASVELAAAVIRDTFGDDAFAPLDRPMMGSEDFAFMLEKVKGAYLFLGNGDSAGLHSSRYDFNDALLERGPAFLHALARRFFA